nr:hypothetical protein 2 [Moraxellaceae bacterium]
MKDHRLQTAEHFASSIKERWAEVAAEIAADCKAAEAKEINRAFSNAIERLDEAVLWAGRLAK